MYQKWKKNRDTPTLSQLSAIINCCSDVIKKKNSSHASLYKGSVFCNLLRAQYKALKEVITHSSGSVMKTCSSLCYNKKVVHL